MKTYNKYFKCNSKKFFTILLFLNGLLLIALIVSTLNFIPEFYYYMGQAFGFDTSQGFNFLHVLKRCFIIALFTPFTSYIISKFIKWEVRDE